MCHFVYISLSRVCYIFSMCVFVFARACPFLCARATFCARVSIFARACPLLGARVPFCARVPVFVRACPFLRARAPFCARVSISERACPFLDARALFCARVPLFVRLPILANASLLVSLNFFFYKFAQVINKCILARGHP